MQKSGMGKFWMGLILVLIWLVMDTITLLHPTIIFIRFVFDLFLLVGLLFITDYFTEGKVMQVILK